VLYELEKQDCMRVKLESIAVMLERTKVKWGSTTEMLHRHQGNDMEIQACKAGLLETFRLVKLPGRLETLLHHRRDLLVPMDWLGDKGFVLRPMDLLDWYRGSGHQ
jgi:hypothetical protein